jgi:TIR domain
MLGDFDVFVSYSTDTKPLAEELTKALEREGIDAWVDFKDLKPGQQWQRELEHAVNTAKWFVIVVAPESHATRWQEAEWSAALARAWGDADKRLLPVVVGGSEPPPFLRGWVPLTVDPTAEPSTWTGRVLDAMNAGAQREPSEGKIVDQQEYEKRLDQIAHAAGTQPNGHPDQPPSSEALPQTD